MSLTELAVFPAEPLYEYRTTLSGREYVLRFDYNGRADTWSLYVRTSEGALVAGPCKIVCGRPLLRHARWKATCPAGELVALDLAGTAENPGAPPGWLDLGRRVRLFYKVEESVPEVLSEQAGGGS